jgi:hypothetical protein
MVSIAELLDWKPDVLGSVADALTRRRRALVDLQDQVDDSKPPATWAAGSGNAARAPASEWTDAQKQAYQRWVLDVGGPGSTVETATNTAGEKYQEGYQTAGDVIEGRHS